MKIFELKSEKLKNIPNQLTLFRVATIPVLVVLLLSANKLCAFLAAVIFGAASLTDFFDGFLARRYGLESTLGKFLDPLADKLLTSAALIMLIPHGRVPAWMVFIIIGREIAVTGLRAILAEKGVVMAAGELGKYKLGFQIGSIIPLLIHYEYFDVNFHAVGMMLLWVALVLTLWSGARYVIKCREIIFE